MKPPAVLDHDAWCPWHPNELARRLSGISRPWCVVGGWALDLWHGYQTRDHDDLEFTILRDDLSAFRQVLKGMEIIPLETGSLNTCLRMKNRRRLFPKYGARTSRNDVGEWT